MVHPRLEPGPIVSGITLALALLNVRGARESAWVIEALAIAKLTPLLIFSRRQSSARRRGP